MKLIWVLKLMLLLILPTTNDQRPATGLDVDVAFGWRSGFNPAMDDE